MMFFTPKMGTTPPGPMDGACVWLAPSIPARAPLKSLCPRESAVNITLSRNGGPLELAGCLLKTLTLAMGSRVHRTPLPIMDADAPVAMAMAEPLTAAYICQFPTLRFRVLL